MNFLKHIPLPFEKAKGTSTIGTLSIVMIYAGIYLKDWASQWLSSTETIVVLASGLWLGAVALAFDVTPKRSKYQSSHLVISALWMVLTISILTTGKINTSSYYLAIICAFIAVKLNPRLLIIILLGHLALTLVISCLEYASGEYFYVYQASDGTVLDENLFGGGMDVFRAKGLFQGPLSEVAFALWMAIFIRGSVPAGAALFIITFFASGRLGMLSSSVLIISRIFNDTSKLFTRLLPWALVLISVATVTFSFAEANRIQFISSALDLDNNQNVSRFDYWLMSLNYYLSFDPLSMIFGDYGFILKAQGGTESDFLRLLLDCGFAGFAMYAGAIITLLIKGISRRNKEDVVVAVLITILMNLFPFVQSLSSAFLFWIYFFATVERRDSTLSRI